MADAQELQSANITLPNGSDFNLMGHVDVLHEDFALDHGIINDRDLGLLSKAMSPEGVIMLGSRYLHPIPFETPEEYAIREKAHEIGMQSILNNGFEQLYYPPLQYNVYTAQNSPAVNLYP